MRVCQVLALFLVIMFHQLYESIKNYFLTQKDIFDSWNTEKKYLHHQSKRDFFVNQKEIWYVKM